MADTPFEYTSSDEEGKFSVPVDRDVDRTKKLSVRISDVVDVSIYKNDTLSGDNHCLEGCDDEEEESSGSLDDSRVEGSDDVSESHYDHPPSSSREERLSESDSVFSEDSVIPEKTIGGKTMQDCIAMMDDGTMSVGSHASDDEGFAKRSKSFMNLFFGGGNVCILEFSIRGLILLCRRYSSQMLIK
jgi:hypothetical protein